MQDALTLLRDYQVAGLEDRRFTHRTYWKALSPFLDGFAGLEAHEIGTSVEGRALRVIHLGSGPTRVLLWSQMHGNESTATMALADLIRFFVEADDAPQRRRILEELTISIVPMLNPDGAESFQRHNALGVDINRDALRLSTPEAKALKSLRDALEPEFGFNLHDQSARMVAGEAGKQVGIALLAPAYDESRDYDQVRSRARLVASVLAEALDEVIPDRLAKYDDTFEPRAFGDNMQAWGTSTILIESGALAEDPAKQQLRSLNAAGILVALDSIARKTYLSALPSRYEDLPFNDRLAHDVILRGGELVLFGEQPYRLDLGLWYEHSVEKLGLRLGEVGDLSRTPALEEIDVSGKFIHLEYSDGDSREGRIVRDSPVTIRISDDVSPDAPAVFEMTGGSPSVDLSGFRGLDTNDAKDGSSPTVPAASEPR